MRSFMGLFLFGILALAGSQFQAKAVEVGFSVGGGRHHSGAAVEFNTRDTGYSTWYPSQTTTVYTTPTYYTAPTTTVYTTPTYVAPVYQYRTNVVEYNGWYGNDRYRNYHHRR